MQKNIFVVTILFGAVFMLGACGTKKPENNNPEVGAGKETQKTSPVEEVQGDDSITGSIKDLLGMGKALKCTWEGEKGMNGETYVDGKRMYSIMKNTPAGPNGEMGDSFVINDEKWMYTWSSLSTDGMKIAIPAEDEMKNIEKMGEDVNVPKSIEKPASKDAVDMNKDYKYSCKPWIVEQAIFTPPTNINFVDMEAMMKQFAPSTKGEPNMAGVCNMLSGEDKIACESQLQ